MPINLRRDISTYDGPNAEAQVGCHRPNMYHPNAWARVEHVLDTYYPQERLTGWRTKRLWRIDQQLWRRLMALRQ